MGMNHVAFNPTYEVQLTRMLGAVDYNEMVEIFKWLKENIEGQWTDRTFHNGSVVLVGPSFHFEDETDAIAFKMRWL